MPWANLDDTFESHRKIDAASLEAIGLYARSLSFCARYLTNGKVDQTWLERVVPKPQRLQKLLDELVATGLFEPNGNGFAVHDYLDYNPSREDVLERRRKAAEKKRRQRLSPRDSGGDGNGES